MIDVAGGWGLDVERGPDWLFVRLNAAPQGPHPAPLADAIWSLARQHFTHRVVLECDRLEELGDELIRQFALLQERIVAQGGVLRLCGLSQAHRDALAASGLTGCFPLYADRESAVMCTRPRQARPRQPR